MITWQYVLVGGLVFLGMFAAVVGMGISWSRQDREEEAERRLREYGSYDLPGAYIDPQ